ncbi:iron-sulfur cluster assembly scaffold protein [Candidatus Peregrinibacteria bacterium]|nr:iron-sulfur cluster assembly scaffold protein [Candidatus Peregrinibacteria bacterium]
MDDLYTEIILDHFKNPKNKGQIDASKISKNEILLTATEYNPACGDKVTMQIVIKNGTIEKIAFFGEGCAISQAASSMLTEHLKGKTLEYLSKMKTEEIYKLLQIPISPARVKCALLGFIAVKNAISQPTECIPKRRSEAESPYSHFYPKAP